MLHVLSRRIAFLVCKKQTRYLAVTETIITAILQNGLTILFLNIM